MGAQSVYYRIKMAHQLPKVRILSHQCVHGINIHKEVSSIVVFPTKAELRESMLKNRSERRGVNTRASEAPVGAASAVATTAGGEGEGRDHAVAAIRDSPLKDTGFLSPKSTGRNPAGPSPGSSSQPVASKPPVARQDLGSTKTGSGAARKATQGVKKGKDDGDATHMELLSAEEHERLRSGLASIMSEMNNIIQAARK